MLKTTDDTVEQFFKLQNSIWETTTKIDLAKRQERELLRTLIATLHKETEEAVAGARGEERERIKKEIMQQTMLNDGSDTFVKLGEALWVCDSIEDRKAFMKALTPPDTK